MDVTLDDGTRIFVEAVGAPERYPLILLHGGPGLDHHELHPWMDALSDTFYLLYVDQRGQGRSERVDPATLSLAVFAADVTRLARALRLERYALFGHSFGSFVTLAHAIERGDASHYIISGGTASWTTSGKEVEENLARFEPVALREAVTRSWAMEPHVTTQEECRELLRMQLPFHFASVESEAYRRFTADDPTVYAPEVLAHFSALGYPIEFADRLDAIHKPTLVVTGEYDRTCTPRAARELSAGIPASELLIIPGAGHMTQVERPDALFPALRDFFARRRDA